MDRVRGGVFSGAMLLAGLSATLLSGLIAIGIRQVTLTASRPVQVTVQHASGEVAVPEAPASVPPSVASGVAEPSLARARSYLTVAPAATAVVRDGSGTTTGSATGAGAVQPTARASLPPAAAPKPRSAAHANAHAKSHGNAVAKGAGNGKGNSHRR